MADTDNNNPVATTGTTATSDALTVTVQGDNANGGGTQPVENKFTQAQVDAVVKERLERERKKGEQSAAKAKADAEADAAAKNGQWEQLAKQYESRVKEVEAALADIEPLTTERDALKGIVAAQLEAQRQGRSADELELLDMVGDPLKQLDWLTKHPPASKPFARVPPTPVADEAKKLSESEIKRRQAEVSRYIGR